MSEVIEQTIDKVAFVSQPTIEDYILGDKEARIKALDLSASVLTL